LLTACYYSGEAGSSSNPDGQDNPGHHGNNDDQEDKPYEGKGKRAASEDLEAEDSNKLHLEADTHEHGSTSQEDKDLSKAIHDSLGDVHPSGSAHASSSSQVNSSSDIATIQSRIDSYKEAISKKIAKNEGKMSMENQRIEYYKAQLNLSCTMVELNEMGITELERRLAEMGDSEDSGFVSNSSQDEEESDSS
jgi:hypothetical protein